MLLLAERLPRDRFQVEFLSIIGPALYDDRARTAGAPIVSLGLPPAARDGRVIKMWRRSRKITEIRFCGARARLRHH